MSSFKLKLLVTVFGLAMLTSCGNPELADQNRDQLTVPEVPGTELSLQGATAELELLGFMVLWTETVPAAGMAGVLDAVFADRAAKVSSLDHYRAKYLPAGQEVEQADQTVADYGQYLQQTYGSSDRLRESRQALAAAWYEERLQMLQESGEITMADFARSRDHFHGYCESKIWEMAASTLSMRNWYRRPSPHLMCEDYYRSQGYFEYGEDGDDRCAATEKDGLGKSYFHCLWQEGVMRSKLFGDHYDFACKRSNPTTKKDQLGMWLDDTLPQVLNDLEFGRQIRSAMLSRNRIPFSVSRAYPILKDCSSVFRLPTHLRSLNGWETAAPIDLRNSVEAEQLVERSFPLLPPTGDLNRDQARWEMLARDLLLMGERPNDQPSLSDYWWVPEAGLSKPGPYDDAALRPSLSGFFSGYEELIPASERAQSEFLAKKAGTAGQRRRQAADAQDELREQIGIAQDGGARAAALPDVSYGFAKMNGLLNLRAGEVQKFLLGKFLETAIPLTPTGHDPGTGIIDFTVVGPDSLFGLQDHARQDGDPYFLDAGYGVPSQVTAQLALRRVAGQMWALTGELTLTFEGSDQVLYGALTLDNYSQERKAAGLQQAVDE